MLECNRVVKKKMALLTRVTTLVMIVACITLLLAQTAFAKSTYLINDGDRVLVHTTYATNPADILSEAGLELGKDDTYTTQSALGVSEITVQRKQNITIIHGDKTMLVSSYGETVEAMLSRLNIILTKEDVLSLPLDTATYDGMALTISRSIETKETYTSVLPHETVYCYDPSLGEGEQVILTEGVDGRLLCNATVYYIDGQEINRVVNSQIVTQQPVDEVVAIGTYVENAAPLPVTPPVTKEPEKEQPANGMPVAENGILTTASGEVLTYTQKMDVVATAYSCNGVPGYTFSGTPARVGAIAVDPTVIPLGTRMYIVSNDGEYIYGIATAEDTGGAIKGHKIDLYFDTFDECWIFGVRDCTVYILG